MTSDWDKANGLVPGLTFSEYQQKAAFTAIFDPRLGVAYPVLGLGGEAGEVLDKAAVALFPEGPPKGWDAVTAELKSVYWAMRNAADACRLLEVAKKRLRDGKAEVPDAVYDELGRRSAEVTPEQRNGLLKEISDVCWYQAAVAGGLSASLADIAQANLDKLAARKATGTIGGSGDDRETNKC